MVQDNGPKATLVITEKKGRLLLTVEFDPPIREGEGNVAQLAMLSAVEAVKAFSKGDSK